ncbi:MAG: hypothetical protein RLO17_01505 [Cyclobacteriaceae bacterium]
MKSEGIHSHSGNAVYGMGLIGAAIYYISTASGFWMEIMSMTQGICQAGISCQ